MNLSAPEFSLQIGTDYEQSGMPDTNIPMDRFYTAQYSNSSLTSFNETDFLQVMALSTKVVLENTQRATVGLQDNFSVMYTPISTGEYDSYGDDIVSMLISMIYESLGICIN